MGMTRHCRYDLQIPRQKVASLPLIRPTPSNPLTHPLLTSSNPLPLLAHPLLTPRNLPLLTTSNLPLTYLPLSLPTVEFEESLVDMERNGLLDHHVFRSLISVATSANTNATDDGGAAATDDGVLSTKSQSSISQYGALLEAVVGELAR